MSKINLIRSYIMSNQSTSLLSVPLRCRLESLNYDVSITPSFGALNPRINASTVWVGMDTLIPDDLKVLSLPECIERYFERLNVAQDDYLWTGVGSMDLPEYKDFYTYQADKLEYSLDNGFIYISKAKLRKLSHGQDRFDQSDAAFYERVAGELFFKEVDRYNKWFTGKIYDIEISALHGRYLAESCYRYKGEAAFSDAIYKCIDSITKQMTNDKPDLYCILGLKLGDKTENGNIKKLSYVSRKLKSTFGIAPPIGSNSYNEVNQEVVACMLFDDLPDYNTLKGRTTKDLEGEVISQAKRVMRGTFDEQALIKALNSDTPYVEWDRKVLLSLVRGILGVIDDVYVRCAGIEINK